MIRMLGSIGRFFSSRGRHPQSEKLPSLVKSIRALVSKSVMREVVASSHDRRQWGVLAAAWVGVSEREFIRAAAREMKMEYEERVPVPDLTALGDSARDVLTTLRRIGCSVIIEGNEIKRYIAVDPAEVRELSTYTGTEPVSIASWSEISRALDSAERLIAEAEANADLVAARTTDELCGRIIDILIQEGAHHGATSIEIVTSDEKTRYQFIAQSGKTGVGTIHPEVVGPLLTHLYRLEGSVRQVSHREVLVRSLGNSSNFKISWRGLQVLPMPSASDVASTGDLTTPQNRVIIPHAEDPHPPRPSQSVRCDRKEPGKISVLVIDDNPMFCRVLERLLSKEGFDPCFADDGASALQRLKDAEAFHPRVIVCDLHMPRMNGKELLANLKEDAALAEIPVIMLTSDDDVEAEVSLLNRGAAAFISKGKDPRILTSQIRRLAQRGNLSEAA